MKPMIEQVNFGSQIHKKRFCSMLSLCKRSGQLVSGEVSCESAIKSNKAKIVFLSSDASENTSKKFINKSTFYHIPIYRLDFSKEYLGKLIGEAQRSVVAITGGDFTKQLLIGNQMEENL